MAKWSFSYASWTPAAAIADAANITDAGHQTLQGGSATQAIALLEAYGGGQAGASSVNAMQLCRDSQVGTGALTLASGAKNAALHTATAALAAPQQAFTNAATNKPQRSTTLGLINLSFNSFGGIVRWVAAPGEEIWILGNAASLGEISFSAANVGTPGLMGSHLIYEPY